MKPPGRAIKPWLRLCVGGARACVSSAVAFSIWAVWLALALLLVAQTYILTSNELAVPGFLLRRLEGSLAESGLRMTFGRTSFDPKGRVLIEDVRVLLPAFPDPVFTARSVFVRLNPRSLLVGGVEPVEITITDATAAAPAQLTPSGRTEEIVRQLDATLEPRSGELVIHQLSARIANLTFSARGTVPLPTAGGQPSGPMLAEFFARRFPDGCRLAIALTGRLAQFVQPTLLLEVTPSESALPIIAVTALARHATLEMPVAVEIDNLRVSTRLLLFGEAPPAPVEVSAEELRFRPGTIVRGLRAELAGRIRPGEIAFDLREATVTADSLATDGVEARAISARVIPQPLPRFDASITGLLLDSPLTLRTDADLTARTAIIRFDGAISPRILDVISRRLGVDVRRYYNFESLQARAGEATFGAGWTFEKLTVRVLVPRMNSYGVIMEDGRATVELTPGRFFSPEAFARVGVNFARGSYEQDLRTREYRFLLEGQLHPLEISPWFGEWWPIFFRQFEFPLAPPAASVDVAGVWREGRQSRVFVFAETDRAIFRGTELDRSHATLFIRPGLVDGLELLATRRAGAARGSFTYRATLPANEWETLDFALESTFDLSLISSLLGPVGAKSLAPFRVAAAPAVKTRGRFFGPKARVNPVDRLQLEARTTGEFRFFEFPLQDVSFSATLQGSDIVVDKFFGTFAEGAASGQARVWGRDAERRVGFDIALEGASLGQAATSLQVFLAQQKGLPPPPPGRFVQERASVHLDLAASAEGRYDDLYSYRGAGNAVLKGAGIGEVPLLGLLSELFTFTSLRFNEARGNFKIDGSKLVFPQIELRGANSAIDAQGHFALDRRELHFNAKIFPFQESNSLLKSVVGAVLSPLSNVLEVKLSGTLEKPQWAFVMGPKNFLRALAEGPSEEARPAGVSPVDARPDKRGP